MVSMADCLQRAVDAKKLNAAHAQAAVAQYDQLVARYETTMPRHLAEARAAADLKEATRKASRSRYHMVVNQLQAMRRLQHHIRTAPDPGVAVRNLIEHSPGSGYTGESVRSLTEAYVSSINAELTEVLEKTGLNLVGNSRNQALLDNLIDELHGDATGDAVAKALADAVRYQQRRMRQQFNAHGGDIGELADYGIAHAHSPDMLRKHGFDAWSAAITPRLAWDRILNSSTGSPFVAVKGTVPSPTDAERFLRDVYDGIVTRGWDDRTPSMTTGGKALYNQRADHRVLHFASGADWRAYNKAFGHSEPFSAMIGGLHGLARDVAMMRVLGPNPRMGLEFAAQTAKKIAEDRRDAKLSEHVTWQSKLAATMLAHADGSVNVPDHVGWAAFFSGTRATLASIQLGSAVLSSVTDSATIRVAALAMGMKPVNVASRTMALSMSELSRKEAARLGYVAQTMAEAGAGSSRYFGELLGTGISQRLAGITLRGSGLTFITDMRRTAFQMEFSAKLAHMADEDFSAIDPKVRQLFESRGITAADWDLLRDPAARFTAPNGEDFISPIYWLEHQVAVPRAEAEGLAMRVQMAIQEELEMALPTMTLEGKARTVGNTKPGSISGEILRSSTSYKGYPLSLMLHQYRRFMAQPGPKSKAFYFANIAAPLLLMGAITVQLKELAKGNDPRPMTDGKFFMAALLQSGGLGIFGDFFASETNRVGGGLGATVAGPTISMAGNIIGLAAEPFQSAIEGEGFNVGRAVSRFQRTNTPVASSLWYTRAAFDRIVSDTLQRFLDPDAQKDWDRRLKQQERDYGNSTWWERGEYAPERAPYLSNIGARE